MKLYKLMVMKTNYTNKIYLMSVSCFGPPVHWFSRSPFTFLSSLMSVSCFGPPVRLHLGVVHV